MAISESDRTLGEVARRLDEVFSRYEKIANDLPLRFVSRDVYDGYRELAAARESAMGQRVASLEKRIDNLESDKTWLYRLIVGAVILALVALVLGTTHATGSSSKATSQQSVMIP